MLFMSHASFHLIFTKLNKVPAIIIIPSKSRLRDESFAQGHRVGKKKREPNSRTHTLNCYLPQPYHYVFVAIRLHDVCKMVRRVWGAWLDHDINRIRCSEECGLQEQNAGTKSHLHHLPAGRAEANHSTLLCPKIQVCRW